MARLNNQQILDLWDLAPTTATARALAMLSAASGRRVDDLAGLPVGSRDGLLIDVREATFGPAFDTLVDCPRCGATLECSFHCRDIRTCSPVEGIATCFIDLPDGRFEIRVPTSRDLEAVETAATAEEAARWLVARCAGRRAGSEIAGRGDISPETAAEVADRIAALDPQAEIVMRFTCTTCGEEAAALFDIAEYLWIEVRARASRLMADVHDLARAYGWSQDAILALSDARRAGYLRLIA
jgi:hypothetical protein